MPGPGFAAGQGKRNPYKGLSQKEIGVLMADSMFANARRILRTMRKKDLSQTPMSQLGVCLNVLISNARLLRDESTSNLAVSGRLDAIVKVQGLMQRLQGALGSSPATPIPLPENASYPSAQLETVEAEVAETAEPVQEPVKRQRGRPRKVKAPPTP